MIEKPFFIISPWLQYVIFGIGFLIVIILMSLIWDFFEEKIKRKMKQYEVKQDTISRRAALKTNVNIFPCADHGKGNYIGARIENSNHSELKIEKFQRPILHLNEFKKALEKGENKNDLSDVDSDYYRRRCTRACCSDDIF